MHTTLRFVAAAGLALVLAACGSAKDANKSNFRKAIQAYLDTQAGLCVPLPSAKIPFTLMHKREFMQEPVEKADALVEAGLLTSRKIEAKGQFTDRLQPANEYQITALGKKYLVDSGAASGFSRAAFCTGKFSVVEVENFTEPGDMMGVKVSQVHFRYKVQAAADWIQSAKLRELHADLSKQAQGETSAKATLILTNDGWVHEKLLRR